MQVVARSLLAASLAAWLASCSFNDRGLDSAGGKTGAGGQIMGATGAAGAMSGVAGDTGSGGMIPDPSGNGGTTALGGASGAAGETSGAGGTTATGAGGDTSGTGGNTSGAGGDNASGTGGTTASGGASGAGGAAGANATGGAGGAGGVVATAGTGGGAGGKGGATGGAGGKGGAGGSPASDPGCADGTREGYLDTTTYPTIAACAGAWDTPGLTSTDSRTPQCDRRAGNDGDKVDGRGCSVADLCESGWHVCDTAHAVSVATMGAGCDDAVAPANGKPVFYVTRQHATGLICDNTSNAGTNNLYGCGNIGSTADKNSCAPFTRMMRDSDCLMNSPWMCSDGPNGTSQDELDVVTKGSSSRGGVLCCHD
jgi:hypothetical protein